MKSERMSDMKSADPWVDSKADSKAHRWAGLSANDLEYLSAN